MTNALRDDRNLSQAERIDQVCTRYEAAWQAGKLPSLEDWLPDVGEPDRPALLKELLLLEAFYRQRAGEIVSLEEYPQRFPEMEESWLKEVLGASQEWAANRNQSTVDAGTDLCGEKGTPIAHGPGANQMQSSETIWYFGNYELREEIGRGGMGVVYRGHDGDLNRTLAVKVLLEKHQDNAELKRRFLDEAKIMGQLQHPGVAPIHEIGQLADGRPFFSMKQIKGKTLSEILKNRDQDSGVRGQESGVRGRDNKPETPATGKSAAGHSPITTHHSPKDLPRLLGIFEQVCQTVAAAHSRGILHRDLKPQNVMVGAFGEVQVMDWGLAKQMQNDEREMMNKTQPSAVHHSAFIVHRSAETQAGRVLGTPAYMAPEQARGEVEKLDERCDVFGLGAILCEILMGWPPFPADTQVDSHRKAMQCDLGETFARLDSCGADAELIQLAKKCLAPAKQDRPRDAAVVAQALAQYQADVQQRLKQAEIQRARLQARLIEQAKRRRLRMALVALSFLCVVAAAAACVWYVNDQAEREIAAKNRQFEEERQEAALQARSKYLKQEVGQALQAAGAARQGLHSLLDDPLKVSVLLSDLSRWREPLEVGRGLLEQARKLADSDPELLDPDLTGQLKQLEDQLAADNTAFRLAETLDRIRQEASILVEGKFNPALAGPRYAQVFTDKLEVVNGSVAQAATQVKASPARFALVAALDHWADVTTDNEQRARLLDLARLVDPDLWRDQVRDPNNWKSLAALQHLADQAKIDKQSPQILILLARRLHAHGGNAVALLERAVLTYSKDFWLNLDLGVFAREPLERVGYLRAALVLRPDSSAGHYNLGLAFYAAKKVDKAIASYKQAIVLDGKSAEAHNNLGLILLEKGKLDEAMSELKTALVLDPKNVNAHLNMGRAFHLKKDLTAAIACYKEGLAIDDTHAYLHNGLGLALQAKGELDEAIACYNKAIARKSEYAEPHNNLGIALYAKKDLEGAIACYRKALALNRDNAPAHNNVGLALMDKGDVDGAIACYHEALTIDPVFAKAHDNLGLALYAKKDPEGAIACWKKAIACDPKFAPPHNNLGNALITIKGDRDGAFACYQNAVKLDPDFVPALNNLGGALYDKRNFDGAIPYLQKALALDPKYIPAHFNMGLALKGKGDFHGAKKSFTQVLKLLPPFDPSYSQAQKLLQKCEQMIDQKRLRP
jgi:tetratricopeptide (TPR) repeat protein/tRNA A-37 threonylcarbamoyl transferase component Bud32